MYMFGTINCIYETPCDGVLNGIKNVIRKFQNENKEQSVIQQMMLWTSL